MSEASLLPFGQQLCQQAARRDECSDSHHGHHSVGLVVSRIFQAHEPALLMAVVVCVLRHRLIPLIVRRHQTRQHRHDRNSGRGMVANFAPKAGTGAGRRVQDMSELEIFE